MFRVRFVVYWILLNAALMGLMTWINGQKVTSINDGSLRLIDYTAVFFAFIILYKVTFGGLHILWFKIRVMCNPKFRVQKFNLRKEVKKMKKGGVDANSEQGSLLSMEEEFLKEEDEQNRDEDQLLDVSMKPDRKMDAALKKKFEEAKAKR